MALQRIGNEPYRVSAKIPAVLRTGPAAPIGNLSTVTDRDMSPARKTRRERQAETREQVVQAARRLFMEAGYQRTSLAAVVEAAGFTKGAVYSNFSSKAELGLAVLEDLERANVAQLAEAFQGIDDAELRSRLLEEWGESIMADLPQIRLRAELSFAALDDPELSEIMRTKSRNTRGAVAAMLGAMPNRDAYLLEVSVLADALSALAVGCGLQRLNDPGSDLTAFIKAASVLTGSSPESPSA